MPTKCAIEGYPEAVELERKARQEIYLGLDHEICGVKVKQVTPLLLARLLAIQSPFICGGSVDAASVAQFLWALSPSYSPEAHARNLFIDSLSGFDFQLAELEIDEFIQVTFLDSPVGRETIPYVSGISWFEYSMAKEPFRWDCDYTLNQPLRRIYQLLRCRQLENGVALVNKLSDKKRDDFLLKVQGKQVRFKEGKN